MIRINLLPQAKKAPGLQTRAPSGGGGGGPSTQVWAAIYLGAVAAAGVGLGVTYFLARGTLEEKVHANQGLQREIEVAKKASGNLEDVKAKLKSSRDLEEVVTGLQKERFGPTRVLMEVSHMLSEGGGPTIDPQRLEALRRENPLAGFNPGWDARRLWITSFEEIGHDCKVKGVGKTNEDVAEFLSRMALSDLFENVTLDRTQAALDTDTGLTLIGFEAKCKVRY